MAGPSVVVLLPDVWTPDDIEEFRAWLSRSFRPDHGDDWWVLRDPHQLGLSASLRPGPILVEVGHFQEEDAGETACLTRAAGFPPDCEIVMAAAVSGSDDHRLLAELAVATTRRYGGMISLDGPLPVSLPDGASGTAPDSGAGGRTRTDQSRADHSRATIMSLGGQWHEIPYRTAGGEVAIYHLVDAELLTAWLRHPDFRMVK